MKKVLLIAARFPPFDTPSVRRPFGLYKELSEYGWEPWVVTIAPDQNFNPYSYEPSDEIGNDFSRVVYTNFRKANLKNKPGNDLKITLEDSRSQKLNVKNWVVATAKKMNLGSWVRAFRSFPDQYIDWYGYALQASIKLFTEHKFDAVISTSGPETSHLIASTIVKNCSKELTWIADYQDLWSQKYSRNYPGFRVQLDRLLEKRTIRTASGITAVSKGFSKKLETLFANKPIRTINIGFDADEYSSINISPNNEKLIITHGGWIYKNFRDPSPLLRALSILIHDKKTIVPSKIEVRFFGYSEEWLLSLIHEFRLDDVVFVHGRIPRHQVLGEFKESSILWVLDWQDPRETGNIPAKVYEYIGCQRYILVTGGTPESEVGQLVRSLSLGNHVLNDEIEIADVLQSLYDQFVLYGSKRFVMPSVYLSEFSQKGMAKQFAEFLDELS